MRLYNDEREVKVLVGKLGTVTHTLLYGQFLPLLRRMPHHELVGYFGLQLSRLCKNLLL